VHMRDLIYALAEFLERRIYALNHFAQRQKIHARLRSYQMREDNLRRSNCSSIDCSYGTQSIHHSVDSPGIRSSKTKPEFTSRRWAYYCFQDCSYIRRLLWIFIIQYYRTSFGENAMQFIFLTPIPLTSKP
jgi:hypothetical protein